MMAPGLLARAGNLPYGFGGFQSPACLNLAEALQICTPGDAWGITDALRHALVAAENIRDESFCARQTARVTAMQRRWWAGPVDILKILTNLLEKPAAPDFSTLHIIGQTYAGRRIKATGARTLEDLVEVYHRPLDEFVRINGRRIVPTQRLAEGVEINVPDPGFPTQLSARFAAQALADPTLDLDERVSVLRRLAPLASANATILDTVLARLLIADRTAGEQLDSIDRLTQPRSVPPAAAAANLPS